MPTAAHRLLSEAFLRDHTGEAARVLERVPAEDAAAFLAEVPVGVAAKVVAVLAPAAAALCLDAMAADRAAGVVAALPTRTAAPLARRMAPAQVAAVLGHLPAAAGTALATLLRHAADTAGALLDPHALALPEDTGIDGARAALVRAGDRASYYLWVVRRDHTLAGVVPLGDLLHAPGDRALGDVLRPTPSVPARADGAMILAHPGWRELHALPVVDDAGAFLGVIPYETFRQLESDRPATAGRDVLADVLTLAEAYLVGVSELLKGLAAPVVRKEESDGS